MSFSKSLQDGNCHERTLYKKQKLPFASKLNYFRRQYGVVARCPACVDLDVCPLWPSCDCCAANLEGVSKRELLGRLAAYDFYDHMFDFSAMMHDRLHKEYSSVVNDMLRESYKQNRRSEKK